MKSTVEFFKKNARHLFLVTACLIMIGGITSCNTEKDELEPQIALDDASLLASQMDNIIKTRASSTIITMVTTAKNISFAVARHNHDLHVNWGDGNVEINTFSHTYTDNLPVHTIFVYGPNDAVTDIGCQHNELIYLDVSNSINLQDISCGENRLTSLDLSHNSALTVLECGHNSLPSIDLSENVDLYLLIANNNYLNSINLSQNAEMLLIELSENLLDSIDLSSMPKLMNVYISGNNLTELSLANNSMVTNVTCNNNQLTSIDLSQTTNLNTLDCYNNQLTTLTIPATNDLKWLYCQNNLLANITIPQGAFSKLQLLRMTNNPLEANSAAVSHIVGNLPDRRGSTPGQIWSDPNGPNFGLISMFAQVLNWNVNP